MNQPIAETFHISQAPDSAATHGVDDNGACLAFTPAVSGFATFPLPADLRYPEPHVIPEPWTDVNERYGKFCIDLDLIHREPDLVAKIMAQCIVVRAENMFCRRSIEYQALSPKFEKLPMGERLPSYEVLFNRQDGVVSFRLELGPCA